MFSVSDNRLINSIYDVLSEHQLEYVPWSERFSEMYLINAAKMIYGTKFSAYHEYIWFMDGIGLAGNLFDSACDDIWQLLKDYPLELSEAS